MKLLLIIFFTFLNLFAFDLYAENKFSKWFIITELGSQISGIKNEDFIKSNISPLFLFEIGKEINDVSSVKIGYRGPYYNLIIDNKKYY